MKLGKIPADGKLHVYCLRCRHEAIREFRQNGRSMYRCTDCNSVQPRALILDPAVNWWVADDGEYWHETAGVFLRGNGDEFLFLERARHPFGLTVPAGHVDLGEAPLMAARRELFEETRRRLAVAMLAPVATVDILGDECRRGSDAHRWHILAANMGTNVSVQVEPKESLGAVWLTFDQALRANPTFALRSIITRYAPQILRATQ